MNTFSLQTEPEPYNGSKSTAQKISFGFFLFLISYCATYCIMKAVCWKNRRAQDPNPHLNMDNIYAQQIRYLRRELAPAPQEPSTDAARVILATDLLAQPKQADINIIISETEENQETEENKEAIAAQEGPKKRNYTMV